MVASYDTEKLEASQPFLNNLTNDYPNEHPGQASTTVRMKKSHHLLIRYPIMTHLLILITYSFAFLFAAGFKLRTSSCTSEILPLPAREAVQWELRPFTTSLVNNPFTGLPRPALDQAWHNLLKSMFFLASCIEPMRISLTFSLDNHIKVPHQALDALNLSSVQLKDENADIASLGMFHALHCLVSLSSVETGFTDILQKKLRQMAYKEHYHHGKDASQMLREQAHSGKTTF